MDKFEYFCSLITKKAFEKGFPIVGVYNNELFDYEKFIDGIIFRLAFVQKAKLKLCR